MVFRHLEYHAGKKPYLLLLPVTLAAERRKREQAGHIREIQSSYHYAAQNALTQV